MKLSLALMIIATSLALGRAESPTNSTLFRKLTPPQKWWVMSHPFIAKKVHTLSVHVKAVADSIEQTDALDRDGDGGQVDAFRHTLWMARIAQEFGPRTALSLGRAHERGNYHYFLENRLEDGSVPDNEACEMDLFNNGVGAKIGKKQKKISESELIAVVLEAVRSGQCRILKKDNNRNFLTRTGTVITREELRGQWHTPKYLVPSDEPPTTR